MIRRWMPFLLFASLGFANPSIGTDGIVNVASYLPSGFPNSGIAQGSIFVVFGSGLGPSSIQYGAFPLPTQLSGTSIAVTVKGTTTNAIMIYTLAGQVAALLPSSTPTGTGTLTLTYNGSASAATPIQVVASSFGIFSVNEQGTGQSVVTFPNSSEAVSLLNSATPGQVYTLWGTGLGPISGDETIGAAGGNMASSLHVKMWVGNQPATLQYAGRSPGSAGLDQINFTVPSGVSGCFVPVAVQVQGIISNFPSIAVSSNGKTCSDPEGPTDQVLQKVAGGQTVRLGLVQLSRFAPLFNLPEVGQITVDDDTMAGYFYKVTPQQFLGSLGAAALNTFGGCVVWTCRGGSCVPPPQSSGTPLLDAGSSLTVKGPDGTKQVSKNSSGAYSGTLGGGDLTTPPFLDPGSYSLTGSGGAVGSFSASQSVLASPLKWTSNQQSTINRSQNLVVNWSGGSANGYVVIIGTSTSGTSTSTGGSGSAGQVTGTLACTAQGASGTYTIPSWVLSALPVTGTLTESGITVSNGFLLMGLYPEFSSFSAPGLDLGFFSNLVLSGQNAQYQ